MAIVLGAPLNVNVRRSVQMAFRCPKCESQIVNRRIPRCERCGEQLPADLLFTPKQIEQLDGGTAEDRKRSAVLVQRVHDTTPLLAKRYADAVGRFTCTAVGAAAFVASIYMVGYALITGKAHGFSRVPGAHLWLLADHPTQYWFIVLFWSVIGLVIGRAAWKKYLE